jgi:hypothetical protein
MTSLDTVPAGTPCPSRQDLAAFNGGDLPAPVIEAIAEHLSRCPRCVSALGTLAGHESNTLASLRRSLREPVPDPFAADPEYRRMEDAAITLYSTKLTPWPWPDAAPAAVPTPPFTLGQYHVVEKIGQGGMGAVYRAVHPRLKKEFAIKVLRAESTADPRAVARFAREMEAVGRLDHHNLVRATDAGEARGLHFFVMELVVGIDLSRLVRLRGPLAAADACELVRQAAAGLQCAHEHGLVHRDVKPSNLVLSTKGEVKVLDLGLALLNAHGPASGELTGSGQVMGTPDYTAPEQWEASHAVDIRADVYSLGCTLYTLLAGQPPFAGPRYASTLRKMAAHARETPAPLAEYRQDVPEPVQRLLETMTGKSPGDRPSTPAEVARALEPFTCGSDLPALAGQVMALLPRATARATSAEATVAGEGTPPTEPAGAGQPLAVPAEAQQLSPWWSSWARRRGGRHRRVAAVVALAVLLTAAVATPLWFWRTDGPPADPEGWQNLLAKRPGERLWIRSPESYLDYDLKTQHLRVQNPVRALVPLGETNAGGYRLQLGFRQLRWQGYFGVYFGGQPGPTPGRFRFQFVALDQMDPPNARKLTLIRSTGLVDPALTQGVSTQQSASAELSRPLESQDVILELDVKPRGLVRVRWNGDDYPALVEDNEIASAVLQGTSDRGEFGIYCWGTNVTVSTARFLQTE